MFSFVCEEEILCSVLNNFPGFIAWVRSGQGKSGQEAACGDLVVNLNKKKVKK